MRKTWIAVLLIAVVFGGFVLSYFVTGLLAERTIKRTVAQLQQGKLMQIEAGTLSAGFLSFGCGGELASGAF
jgi:hypothetical protein